MPRGMPVELLERCRAHVAVTPNGVISHVTAARIHGLFLPARLEASQLIDLSQRPGTTAPRRKHTTGHILDLGSRDVVIFAGVTLTSVQRTLIDLAPLLTVEELVVVGDQIVCEHHSQCLPPKTAMVEFNILQTYIAQHAGARGMRKLRAAMELVRVGADSPPETELRLLIARSPLPNFEPNVEIVNGFGKALVVPDLACEEYRTCAEYDGKHHFTPEQQSKDHDRDFITLSQGWHQALINKEDMRAGERVVVTKLARMLKLGGWPDPQSLASQSFRGQLNSRKDYG
ncbi:endonuclease domain-containing protein [Arthrobacter sp. HLT1-20]